MIKLLLVFIAMTTSIASGQTTPKSRPPECSNATVTEHYVSTGVMAKLGNWERPIRNVSRPVVVNITLALSSINDVIERQRILRITGYISMRWFDELRVWNTTFPLNCVTYVVMPASNIWLPDVAEMNAEGRYILMQLSGEKVRIYSDGFAIFSPGGTFNVFCDFDCTYFPFDEQKCAVKFESWRYTHPFMQFRFHSPNVLSYQWSENGQWSLVNTSQKLFGLSYFDPENSFDRVEFYLHLKRKSSYYLTSIVVPCALILAAQIAVFTLPVEEVQKLTILFTGLLSYLVFELMVMDDLPRSSDHVPLLTKYIDVCMASISLSILGECAVFGALSHANTLHPDGPGYVGPVLGQITSTCGKIFRIYFPKMEFHDSSQLNAGRDSDGNKTKVEGHNSATVFSVGTGTLAALRPHDGTTRTTSKHPATDHITARLQWRAVAHVIDRINLIIYLLTNIASPIIMFVIIPNSSE